MGDHLNDFLIEMASDPERAEAFRRDPESVVSGTALTDSERKAVLSGDSRRVRAEANDASDPPTAIAMGPPTASTADRAPGKAGKKKKRKKNEPPPTGTKQRKKKKRAPASRKTSRKTSGAKARKTSRKSSKKR